jgi:type I restriction enzyme S subunit
MEDQIEKRTGYKKTKEGWIPLNWECTNISKIIKDLHPGVSVNAIDCQKKDGEYGVLKVSAVANGVFLPKKNKVIKKDDIEKARENPKAGSLIISRANTSELVGACGYVKADYSDLFLSDKLWQTEFDPDNVCSPEWLNSLLQLPRKRYEINIRATGTSGSMKNISQDSFLSLRIAVPPLPEQKKIAKIISTWDTAIEKNMRLIEVKEKYLKGKIQRLISQRCDSWPHIQPKKIFDTITEKNFPTEELLSVTQDHGVLPRSMLEGRVMSPNGTTASYKRIKRGDFAISLRSFQGGIEFSYCQGIISPAYTVLRPKIELNSDFYRLFFKSYIFIEKYLDLAVIGIRDGKQISIPDFMSIKIPVPALEEQQQIAKILTVVQQEIDLLKQLQEKYKTQKHSLMKKLLTGEVRVNP